MDKIPKYSGPDQEKHQPLDRKQTRKFIETAIEQVDPLDVLCTRVPLSTGIRVGELTHLRPGLVDETYSKDYDRVTWFVRIPAYIDCIGGAGPTGQANRNGGNLHKRGHPCSNCRNRSTKTKDWLTEEQKQKPGFSPKTESSIEKYQWFLPGRDELAQTLKQVVEVNGQFPIMAGAVNRRINKVASEAGIERKVTAHCLRHTYGCKLGASPQFNLNKIMTYMRHQDIKMALWYSDQWGERRRAALENYEDAFSKSSR